MAVDKDLFLYDLAVVAIMKNEAPYVKEWLDYHLAAGVDHFYIYDNESPDNFKEVLQPYINAGIVTYKFYPGTGRQVEAYTEAFKTYRFFCRYIAFIDADEFIFPQNTTKSIPEVVDEILKDYPNAGGVAFNWMMYGSNNLKKADYTKGVLERFTRRAENFYVNVKTIANPRRMNYLFTPHYFIYFNNSKDVYEEDISEKPRILINHYKLKSREEYQLKINNGSKDASYGNDKYYNMKQFSHAENNDVFDDSILAYRDARLNLNRRSKLSVNYEKLFVVLMETLEPITRENLSPKFFEGKMETFLICRALASYFKENLLDQKDGEILEKSALTAINLILNTNLQAYEAQLFFSELPNLLPLNYPIVKNIRSSSLVLINRNKLAIQSQIDCQEKMDMWQYWNEFDNLFRILKGFENYSLNP